MTIIGISYALIIYNSVKINQIQVSQNDLQPIRFQGQFFDTETGLHYNRFRYYDPDMGMFTTRDPIGLRGGDNVFQYGPNPTGWIDPLGLNNWNAFGDAFGGSWVNQSVGKHEASLKHQMRSCPQVAPSACTNCNKSDKWRKYGGDSNLYHCGFDGYLENRIPNTKNKAPTNECFYDHSGKLVDNNHKYKGCRGTPDDYPFYGNGDIKDYYRGALHLTPFESGGPTSKSEKYLNLHYESKLETNKYFRENPSRRPKGWIDPAKTNPVYSSGSGP